MTARNDAARAAAAAILAEAPAIGPRALATMLSVSVSTAHAILQELRPMPQTSPTLAAVAAAIPSHPPAAPALDADEEALAAALAAAQAQAAAAQAALAARQEARAQAEAARARAQAEAEARAQAEAAARAQAAAARPAATAACTADLPAIVSRWHAPVPTPLAGWIGRADQLAVLADWLAHPEDGPLMLCGPKGSGKTSLLREACARAGRPMLRINGHRDMAASDLIGTWLVRSDRSLAWNDGPIPAAMRLGAVAMVDEFDRVPSGSASVLQAVMEGDNLTIPETGEIVSPAPGFALCLSANSIGDSSGSYAATLPVDAATLDRPSCVLRVDSMSGPDLQRLAEHAAPRIGADALKLALSFHASLCAAAQTGDLREPPSPRRLRALARYLSRGWDARLACAAAYADRLDPAEGEAVRSILDRLLTPAATPTPTPGA